MRDVKIEITRFEAFQKKINLDLFYGLLHMILNLTEKKDMEHPIKLSIFR